MFTLLSAVFGFLAPFLPEVLKFFNNRQEMSHERELMKLRLEAQGQEHMWRMEEIAAEADIAEAKTLRRVPKSLGVGMLDAMQGLAWPTWLMVPAVYVFVLVDFLAALVRPVITYAFVAFYIAYKVARLRLMQQVSDMSFSWYEGVINLWGEQDWAVLTLILAFWFGNRTAKHAFGWK